MEKRNMLTKNKSSHKRLSTIKWLFVCSIPVLLFAYISIPASAALFYTGGIVIDTLSVTIDVTDRADVTLEYELANQGDDAESASLTVSPANATALIDGSELSNPVAFEPGQRRTLMFSYSLSLPDADYQSVLFAPMLLFDGMASAGTTGKYDIKLILPDGIERITYSNMSYDDTSTQDGRLVLLWEITDIYPTPFSVSWTTLDVDIAATKTVTPPGITTAGEVIEVEVTIENKGDNAVGNITITDSFYPGTFEAVSPLDEFELAQEEMSDPHLYWTKNIGSLEPGETVSYTYSVEVKALGLETRLDALVVSVNGIPVGVSNDVLLFSELEGRYQAQVSECEFPTMYVIIGVVVVAAIIASAFIIRSRRKA
jgi:hypothetical protein